MKKLYVSLTFFLLLFAAILHAQPGILDLTFNPGTGANNVVHTTLIQPDGKIIIAGDFTLYNGIARGRISRLHPDGSLDNTFAPGTGANERIGALALQPDGKILITGSFTQYNGTPRNRVARLNADGSLDTTFNPGTGANSHVESTIALQADGKIIIGGQFFEYNGVSRYGIARLNANGSLDATFDPGSGVAGYVRSLMLQPDGKILVGGEFSYYDDTPQNNITRINTDGSLDTSFHIGTGANFYVQYIALQPDNKILFGGGFVSYNNIQRPRIARLHADGTLDLSFNPGIGPNGFVFSIISQPDGKILLGGNFTAYGGITRNFITRTNSNGSIDNTFNPLSGTDYYVSNMALYPNEKIMIGGAFTSYAGTQRNSVARLINYCTPNSNIQTVDACETYTWIDGNTYTASNQTATKTFTNSTGCDSIITLNLTIHQPSTAMDTQEACDSFLWIDGITYTQNNHTATHTLSNATGCDSLVTLNLTVKHSSTTTDVHSSCDSYAWIDGNTYTQSNNTATYTLTNAAGCDSIITLNLSIQHSSTSTDTQNSCGSFLWMDGNTYTQSNHTATYTLTNATGCDSIITLDLVIESSVNTEINQNGNVLIAEATGTTYQWINCNGNTLIEGATDQSYTASANGSYAVIVTQGNCSDSSACQSISTVSINENEVSLDWKIFPNPSNGYATVTGNIPSGAKLALLNSLGETLSVRQIKNSSTEIDFNNYASGVYFIKIDMGSSTSVKKVIKQ